jgi:AMP-polyphosphate phosphotransferase
MLDKVDLSLAISKKAFKSVQSDMLERIFELSEMIYEQKRPVVIVFEGWDAAGKGTTIRSITERLDARGYKVLPTQAARTHEKQKPWLWRFWMNIPRYGQIAIFDRSWYGRVLIERVEGITPVPEWIAAYEEINQFERTLADDGTIFLKFWLHISKQEQLRRYIELTQQPETAWQVAAEDWEHHRKYDEYVAAVRDMLANTNTPCASWTVVPATDREYRLYTVCRTIIAHLEEALKVEPTRWPAVEELDAYNATADAEKQAKKLARQLEKVESKAQKEAKKAAKQLSKQAQSPEDGGDAAPKTKKVKKGDKQADKKNDHTAAARNGAGAKNRKKDNANTDHDMTGATEADHA